MVKASEILGLNARARLFSYTYNTLRGRNIAMSKLRTKKVLSRAGIAVPDVYARFKTPQRLAKFDWGKLPASFALKPNRGLGGEGIIVVKKRSSDSTGWITTKRTIVTPCSGSRTTRSSTRSKRFFSPALLATCICNPG